MTATVILTRLGRILVFFLACLFSTGVLARAIAGPSVAVLGFESYNLTPIADTKEDIRRTAALGGMLEAALQDTLDVRIVSIDPALVRKADAGVGYLFEHADVAAELGRAHGADWVLVGRLHKPSFLFAYLMARLVDTRTDKVAEDLIVEVKGQQHIVIRKGIERLAEKLAVRLKASAGGTRQRCEAKSHTGTANPNRRTNRGLRASDLRRARSSHAYRRASVTALRTNHRDRVTVVDIPLRLATEGNGSTQDHYSHSSDSRPMIR